MDYKISIYLKCPKTQSPPTKIKKISSKKTRRIKTKHLLALKFKWRTLKTDTQIIKTLVNCEWDFPLLNDDTEFFNIRYRNNSYNVSAYKFIKILFIDPVSIQNEFRRGDIIKIKTKYKKKKNSSQIFYYKLKKRGTVSKHDNMQLNIIK